MPDDATQNPDAPPNRFYAYGVVAVSPRWRRRSRSSVPVGACRRAGGRGLMRILFIVDPLASLKATGIRASP